MRAASSQCSFARPLRELCTTAAAYSFSSWYSLSKGEPEVCYHYNLASAWERKELGAHQHLNKKALVWAGWLEKQGCAGRIQLGSSRAGELSALRVWPRLYKGTKSGVLQAGVWYGEGSLSSTRRWQPGWGELWGDWTWGPCLCWSAEEQLWWNGISEQAFNNEFLQAYPK